MKLQLYICSNIGHKVHIQTANIVLTWLKASVTAWIANFACVGMILQKYRYGYRQAMAEM